MYFLTLYTVCEQHSIESWVLIYLDKDWSLINSDTLKIYFSNLVVIYILNLSFWDVDYGTKKSRL